MGPRRTERILDDRQSTKIFCISIRGDAWVPIERVRVGKTSLDGASTIRHPISLFLENRNLSFVSEGDLRVARVAVYGLITSITNKVIAEFEDDLDMGEKSEDIDVRKNTNEGTSKI